MYVTRVPRSQLSCRRVLNESRFFQLECITITNFFWWSYEADGNAQNRTSLHASRSIVYLYWKSYKRIELRVSIEPNESIILETGFQFGKIEMPLCYSFAYKYIFFLSS